MLAAKVVSGDGRASYDSRDGDGSGVGDDGVSSSDGCTNVMTLRSLIQCPLQSSYNHCLGIPFSGYNLLRVSLLTLWDETHSSRR